MTLDDIFNLRRRRDQRPEPQRLNEQLPSRGGIDERGGNDRPTSKAQNESAAQYAAEITGDGRAERDFDAKAFANRITES